MESIATSTTENSAQEKVRKYFREVMQKHQLPALPVVVMKVLGMVQDPECDVRALCRVLSDEESSLFQAGRKCGDPTWRNISGNCNDE